MEGTVAVTWNSENVSTFVRNTLVVKNLRLHITGNNIVPRFHIDTSVHMSTTE